MLARERRFSTITTTTTRTTTTTTAMMVGIKEPPSEEAEPEPTVARANVMFTELF